MRLKRSNAKWEFSIHLDAERGPNRVTFDPNEAKRFFTKLRRKHKTLDCLVVKVVHLDSKLSWETDDPEELAYFIDNLVQQTGILK